MEAHKQKAWRAWKKNKKKSTGAKNRISIAWPWIFFWQQVSR
jgi:hypothetical protein